MADVDETAKGIEGKVECHFCADTDLTDDHYCKGCKVYVCDGCNEVQQLTTAHDPSDHLHDDEGEIDFDDDDDDDFLDDDVNED